MDTYEELRKAILFNMKKYRTEAGLKQYQMAQRLGYKPGLYNKIELGNKNLRLDVLFRFCKELDVPLADMFTHPDVKKRPLGEKFEKLMSLPEDERQAVERMMEMVLERQEMLAERKSGTETGNG